MNCLILIIAIVFTIELSGSTLSPPASKSSKKTKEKVNFKTGAVNQDVYQRDLVVKDPKTSDITQESGLYHSDVKRRKYLGNVLGYITPWNSNGYEISKIFHGKLTMVSPVWFSIPYSNLSTFELSTHDVKKKWLKDIRELNNEKHYVKILPRVLFEHWSLNDISRFQSDTQKQTQLIASLLNIAKTFKFDGYTLEMWNQFAFTGINTQTVISIVKNIAEKLKENNLDVILTIPPSRGTKNQLFTKDQFDDLASYIDAFSLMTYDYSSIQRPGPNSPLAWARQCVEFLVPEQNDPRRAQILLGLNFYGYNYTPEGGGPIVSSQYLNILEHFKGKIQWDNKSKEHFFESKLPINSGFVFYPTLYSIKHRLDLAAELGTGISIWELGQGLNYFYDLL